jgi:signal transduction histidine kinase
MVDLLCALCAALIVVICILLVKIALLRKAADEIRTEFAARLASDTNVGIDITTADRKMRQLAADVDRQLKLLRKEHIRYAQGDREIKEAITNISHDLRTPLTAICGYMDLLEREDTSESVRRYLGVIANRVEALKLLTEELFRYSVVVSVNQYDSREAVALNQALEESVAAYYGALKEKGITPEIFIPEVRIERRLNKIALSRILGNVISNAIKYSNGDLRIELSEQGVITFSNRAAQLDEVTIGRLFDRFYTVENGQNSTGLGLSIAKILTEQMRGSIKASKAKDNFSIEIQFT